MNCETVQELLTARLTGELEPAELAAVEAHLENCPACAAEALQLAEVWRELGEPRDATPSAEMRRRFDQLLAGEAATAAPLAFGRRGRNERPSAPAASPTLWAGLGRRLLPLAAMLLLGLGLGYFAFGRRAGDGASLQSLQSLQREVGDLHTMVALSLLEKGSVSERLQGVAFSRAAAVPFTFGNVRGGSGAGEENRPDARSGGAAPAAQREQIVAALFTRLLEDPNVNVRLAALEALRPLAASDDRRSDFVAAVSRQESPLVALSLIDLLIESGTPAARHDLEQLLANDQLDPVVRGYLRDRLGRSA